MYLYGNINNVFVKKFEEVKILKSDQKIKAISVIISVCLIGLIVIVKQNFKTVEFSENNSELLLSNNILEKASTNDVEEIVTDTNDENEETTDSTETIVYDGLTKEQLVAKLNRNLNSTLEGTGEIFADYALELGIDPYLAVAIVLHETGCSWNCSTLVTQCNNVGGMKGSPGCGGGSYASFSTLEEGISRYMNNLYNNYYVYGLTTPETINPKYAQSTTWASKINYYINKIRAS